jgi:hypothetical protein
MSAISASLNFGPLQLLYPTGIPDQLLDEVLSP